jgi:hypothetical protein
MSTSVAAVRNSSFHHRPELKISASMAVRDQIAILEQLIRRPPATSQIIQFSPKLAAHVLSQRGNQKNRPRKHAKIRQYADDLSNGRWSLTGDTIKFGADGILRDGQNRLAACLRSGRPLTTHVVFGIDPGLFSRMDIGKNRSGADVFSIAGIPHANYAASTIRWLLILDSDNPSDRGAQFTNDELLAAYQQRFNHDQIEHSIKNALEVRRSTRHPVGPLAALHYLFSLRNQQKADSFYEEWATGRAKKARAPSRYLQRTLVEIARARNNRIHETVRNALIIIAWNAYVANRSLTKKEMRHAPDDKFPKILA